MRFDVCEYGRLDEVSFCSVSGSAEVESCALGFTGFDVVHYSVVLDLGDLGALEGGWVEGVAYEGGECFDVCCEFFDEGVVDS